MKTLSKVMVAASIAIATMCASPASADDTPELGFTIVNTPYGAFGCKQRAEQKLFSIGATSLTKSAGLNVTWAKFQGTHSIGIFCRGSEAVIMVAGNGDTSDIRNELKSAF